MFVRLLAPLLLAVSGCFAAFHERSSVIRRNSTGLTDAVTWDPHSLFIQGQRVFILSAEIHPWRLPGNPDLWADVFQKIKANGFNTVSFYVNWALHFPTPDTNGGEGDFEAGTYRDIELFIQEAKNAGLWMIARPGPYINGETTGGGFPGWVGNIAGSLRTNNPNYTQAWTPYLTAISKIIARNQITNGGPIILVQAENEFSAGATQSPYMQAVINTYRANGIVIPITHNDQHAGAAGNFSPDLGGEGAVNIYCGDSYPQGANSWAQVQAVYYSNHIAVAPSNPLCLAEFGGGFLLNWGGVAFGGTGYEKYSINPGLTNADYENVFYKDTYSQTATILNIYMLFGGTNWGGTAAPVSYTSYDYGGGINENRVTGPKMNEMRLQGLFLRVSRDLLAANLLANGTNYTTSALIHTAELRNLGTGAGFYFTRHDSSVSTALTTTQITVTTSIGSLLIPQTGVLTFNGREAKILVTDYVFGESKTNVLYSTAEIMTWTTIDKTDYIILYAPSGQTGETSFVFSSAPNVNLAGVSGVSSTFSNGTLVLNYSVNGSAFVPITLGTTSIVAVILDKPTANQWHAPVIAGSGTFGNFFSIGSNQTVLVSGPYVLRAAAILKNTLSLTGDLNGTTAIEVVAPKAVTTILWNNVPVRITKTARGSITGQVGSEKTVELPTLANWKVSGSLPEIDPDFDDSAFTLADLTTTNYTNLPPLAGRQVLYSQQYGFYGNNLIFRGRFTASGEESAVNLTVQYGFAGGYSTWLNGVFLGSSQGSATISLSTDSWPIPAGALKINETNILVVFQDHMGITETNTNGGKEPRGIRGYALVGGNTTFDSWRLQGNLGGAANAPDTFRGYLNEGALWAERIGAHLPGFPDSSWASGSPLSGVSKAGINFYRTTFELPVSVGTDAPVRLSVTRSNDTTVSNFRLQFYLNGWQMGKYVNSIGPQTIFVLPASILRRQSTNTLGVSVWAMDETGAVLEGLELISDGVFSTSLRFSDYVTPDFAAQENLRVPGQFIEPM
ncbi:glycoside hydrolase family 35 protein [Mycena metata]|uniref:Beta-galactosidase n=1 Tax=Mycena metata TaxID=1033252 RepID=A0AAD7H801_9AGAR|nr:glycoside hydrolase family 35 protein [Mycena metata]